MNCLFILVLLSCCGCNFGRNQSYRYNDGCNSSDDCSRNDDCSYNMTRTANAYSKSRQGQNDCSSQREREYPADSCSCGNQQENSCQETRTMRYDEGMRSYARQDTVPEMRESMSRSYPMYPENCGCNDRN